jgi:hypothetical protein
MDDQTKHSASFPPPVFASKVLRARLLGELKGLRWVWDEFEVSGRYVLPNSLQKKGGEP